MNNTKRPRHSAYVMFNINPVNSPMFSKYGTRSD